MSLAAGTRFGPYEILAPLGAGGMGEVYRARDARLEREVALKVLPGALVTDKTARARLLREARLASKLNHPHVCTIHEVGEADGQVFVAMELVDGETLAARLSGGALSLEQVERYGQQVAEALAHAHGHGVVHRDLKSANIVITPEGRAKVLDFGLAKRLAGEDPAEAPTLSQASLTAAGTVTGTLAYMAPEQLRGKAADVCSDIWALGVVLYEMATGSLPFHERLSSALIDDIIHKEPPTPGRLRHDLSPRMEQIILKCLEKEPGNRYQSARDLLVDLRRLGSPVIVREAPRPGVTSGRRAVLGLSVAVAILGAGVAGYLAWKHRGEPAKPRDGKVMLAVLPVENLSPDPEQDYFSDGLTEEMIAQLGRLQPRRLGVIARTSAMRYKRSQKPVDQIGRELRVDYILESSLRREAGRVRITAQLIQVRDQTHLWAESYERPLTGILAIQSDVAERVARSLAVELLPTEQARLGEARPVNPEAHDLYLKGRHHWNLRTPKDFLKATEYFRAAIAADPAYALAWAGLGDTYALYPHYGVLEPKEAFPQARTAAEKALSLDPALVEAETALAFVVFYFDWDWAGTETRLKAILERRPDYATARQWYAEYLSAMGRHDRALREIRRARETDPLSPVLRVMEGYVLLYARRYEEALESLRRAEALEPNYPLLQTITARTFAEMGRYPEALEAYRRGDNLEGSALSNAAEEARVLALSGKRNEAKALIARLSASSREREPRTLFYLAGSFAALGETGQTMLLLESGFEERAVGLVRLRVDPRWDPLRADSRFQDLLRRMNFPAKGPDA